MTRSRENRIAFLRPGEILERLKAAPVVYVPFGPLEWHGPHLAYGMDPLNAENVALKVCRETGGLVWPTQFWGTERERTPRQLESLGFERGDYVVGMDFPGNPLRSMYCPEEVFAVVVREILREAIVLGARIAVLVNGHGGENHLRVLERLAVEFSNTSELQVMARIAAPREVLTKGSGGHADAGETSILMHIHPECVDLAQLPPPPEALKYTDYAVVDGPGFDGEGPTEGILGRESDPRASASAELGRDIVSRTVSEVVEEVREVLC